MRAVYSRDGEEVAGNHAEVRAIPRGPLTEPRDLSASRAGDGTVALSWTDPSDASLSGYQYRYKNPGDADWNPDWTGAADSDHTTTSVDITGLTNYLLYTFEVRAYRADTDTSGPPAQTSIVPRGPLTAPSNLTATSDDDKQSTLAWDASPDNSITSYQYRVSGDGGAEWDLDWTDIPSSGWSTTAYTVRGLTNRIPYTFEVRTARTDQTGPAARAGGTPEGPPTVPNTPKDLRARGQDGVLELDWHAPPLEDDRVPVTSYTGRYRPEGLGSWTTITGHKLRKGVTWQYLTINGLENSQHYEVQVAAVNRLGAGPWTSAIGTPQPGWTDPPPPP